MLQTHMTPDMGELSLGPTASVGGSTGNSASGAVLCKAEGNTEQGQPISTVPCMSNDHRINRIINGD